MPFTVLDYAPQAKFDMTRSNVFIWRVAWDYPTTAFTGKVVRGLAPLGLDIYAAEIELKEAFWNWSSNHYTLDFPVERAEAFLNGVKYADLALTIQWTFPPYSPYQGFQVNHALGAPYVFDTNLPEGVAEYWNLKPLPYTL